MALHTTNDIVTQVRRALETTRVLPLPECPPAEQVSDLITTIVEEIEAGRWMLSMREHFRLMDTAVQEALAATADEERTQAAYDDGYAAALDDIDRLADASEEKEKETA